MVKFPISDDRLRKLQATRQGRAAGHGFEYQMAYAVARLASMEAGRPVLDLADVPRFLRYDWAEDIDELCMDGSAVFTQCKNTRVAEKSKLAKILLGFIPKLLWADPDEVASVRFRLVSNDNDILGKLELSSLGADLVDGAVLAARQEILEPSPSRSDRALWQDDCIAAGLDEVLAEVVGRTSLLYLSDKQQSSSVSGDFFYAERRAIDLLLAERLVAPDHQAEAAEALRRILRTSALDRTTPIIIDQTDTRSGLLAYAPIGEQAFRTVVDRAYLDEERRKPKRVYLARPPSWADVAHGGDTEIKYVEREQLGELLDRIDVDLLSPLRHGDDSGLPALFLTGAPGQGKSTLVRRAAAILVDRADVVVVDLGVNQHAFVRSRLDDYVRRIDHLSRANRPVLVVMDDPFFAESGWDAFLEELSQSGYRNIAVLGASPTYLFDTYATKIIGRRVRMGSIEMRPSTAAERRQVSRVFGKEPTDQPDSATDDSDEVEFLVVAMEQAAGETFRKIIDRLWITLNDGRPISQRTRAHEVRWPLRAFLVCAFLHRHDISCPEALLRAALSRVAPDYSQTDYVEELAQLTVAEGWNIFRVSPNDPGTDISITTMHSQVAILAWQWRPLKGVKPADWLLPDSFKIRGAAAIFAQFILSTRERTVEPDDHALAGQLVAAWTAEAVPTPRLCELVAGVMPIRSVALEFRTALRSRMNMRDGYSWLAATRLREMARPNTHESRQLADYNIPHLLNNANLSVASRTAVGLLSDSRYQEIIVGRLWDSLDGKVRWRFDGRLMTWLLENRGDELQSRFTQMTEWMSADHRSEAARIALMRWYQRYSHSLAEEEHRAILGELDDWVSSRMDNESVMLEFISILPQVAANSTVLVGAVENLLSGVIGDWLASHPNQANARVRFLACAQKLNRLPGTHFGEVITDISEWLVEHPDSEQVRVGLLGVVRELGDASPVPVTDVVGSALAWLVEHPDSEQVRVGLLGVVRELGDASPVPITDVVDSAVSWLAKHPDSEYLRVALLGAVRDLWNVPGMPVVNVVVSAAAWLVDHPDSVEVRVGLLATVRRLGAASPVPVTDVAESAVTWLVAHPEVGSVRVALLGVVRDLWNVPGMPVVNVVESAAAWLVEHPDSVDVRVGLLATVRRLGAASPVPVSDVVESAAAWLAKHPEAQHVRAALTAATESCAS